MSDNEKRCVFLIDGEPLVFDEVQKVLAPMGFEVKSFRKAADCLKSLRSRRCDLLMTEMNVPDMDIVSLLEEIKVALPWLSVLIVTDSADVPSVVAAVKAGAEDVLEKPCSGELLKASVTDILERARHSDNWRGRPLSRSEMRVLELVVDAKSNKEIAHMLHRSVRTVEVHRSHIMRKLGANNLIDLVKRAAVMGIIDLPSGSRKARKKLQVVKRAK